MERALEEKVEAFLAKHDLSTHPVWRLLDVISEAGELSKEMLIASDYGTKPVQITNEMRNEMADLVFSVVALAGTMYLEVDELVDASVAKYEKRIQDYDSPASNM